MAPQALAADPGGSAHRDAQADGAPVAGETPAEALLGGGLEGGGAGREGAGGVEAGEEDDGAVEVGDRAFAGGGREQLEGRHEHIAHARAATVRGGERALCARRGGEGEAERDAVCPRGGKPEAVGVGRGGEQGGGGVERVRLVVEHVPRRRQLCERSDRDTPPAITHLQTPPHAPCRRPPAGPRSPAPRPHAPPPAPAPPPPPPHTPAPPPRPPSPAHAPSCSPPAAPFPRPRHSAPAAVCPATAASTARPQEESPAPATTAVSPTQGAAACPAAPAVPPRQTAIVPAALARSDVARSGVRAGVGVGVKRGNGPVCFRSMVGNVIRRPCIARLVLTAIPRIARLVVTAIPHPYIDKNPHTHPPSLG